MVRRKTVPRENFEKINRQLLALQSAAAAITSSLDLQQVLNTVTQEMVQLFNVPGCAIFQWNMADNTLALMAEMGPEGWWDGSSQRSTISLDEFPLLLKVLTDQEATQVLSKSPGNGSQELEYIQHLGQKSLLILPMIYKDHVVGLVELKDAKNEHWFSPGEISIAQVLANQAAIAIHNARLYTQAQAEISERKRVTQALQESEERYALAVRGANDGIWDWNLQTDTIYLSPRWRTMLGDEESDLETGSDSWLGRVHPNDRHQLEKDLQAHLTGRTGHFENEHRLLHCAGTYRWVLARGLAVRDDEGEPYRMAGSMTDISDRKQAEQQLLYDAFHDSLTGLPNRALFLDRLDRALERNKRRGGESFSVLFLDLDRFKVINDSLGHAVGDKLLIAVARRLEVTLRTVDTIARIGGDEFVILLEDIENLESAMRIADRIQGDIKQPFEIDGHQIFTSTSIGLVISAHTYKRPEDLLRDADIALYHAKSRGRARFEVFDKDMRLQAKARLTLENDLRRAIGNQEFLIHYQPIVSLNSGRLLGFEALVRWPHPERGYIAPAEFIPVAEETSLIIPIDWWVLREACSQLKRWQEKFPYEPALTMSVNLSSKHFSQFDLVQQIENILRVTDLHPQSLILEITENAIIENQSSATKLISNLRSMGVQVQIDDFGTGYSSLSYIQKYPIDAIKIDQSFIKKIGGKSTDLEIVRTIVRLARDLGIEAIAEGVETTEQLEKLRSLDCDSGQGYLFARPNDPASIEGSFEELLRQLSEH